MKSSLYAAVAVFASGVFLASAWACDKDPKCGKSDAKVVTVSEGTGGCQHAKKASAESDGSGCCAEGKQAKTVADADGGCPHAKKAAAEAAHTGCGATDKDVKTVSGDDGGCPHAKKAVAESSGCSGHKQAAASGKNVDVILASLPSMKYKIGDTTTGCSKSAAAMAAEKKAPVMYLVGDETFDSEGEAVARLTKLLEGEVESMQAVQYSVGGDCMRCPTTAKKLAEEKKSKVMYRLAGFDFPAEDQAEKAAKLAKDAADQIKLSYKVGDQTFCCDKMAGAAAKKSESKMTYVVGERETCCEKEAKMLLTEAKVRAMVEAASSVYQAITS